MTISSHRPLESELRYVPAPPKEANSALHWPAKGAWLRAIRISPAEHGVAPLHAGDLYTLCYARRWKPEDEKHNRTTKRRSRC